MRSMDLDSKIISLMALFVTQVKSSAAMNRTDLNRVAQNVLIPLFAEIYGYRNLRNLDTGTAGNFPGIDLADDEAKISIQVTATEEIEKVKHTLEQFVKNRYEERFSRLIIYIITEKQKRYSQSICESILDGRFKFDVKQDICDFTDLIRDIEGLEISQKEKVLNILQANIGGWPMSKGILRKGLIRVPESWRTEYYIGREDVLRLLHRDLSPDDPTARTLVLSGMGGIGKTQTALEYIRLYGNQYTYILWANAESEIRLVEDLKSITYELLPETESYEESKQVLTALHNWITDYANPRWLLVIDGADFSEEWTQARLKGLLPACDKHKVLITSRYQEFPAFRNATVVPIGMMSEDEALTFFGKFASEKCQNEQDQNAAKTLARSLSYLPLALEQAAAYVLVTPGMSFSSYNQLVEDYGLRVLPTQFDHAADYPHSVQTVCEISFQAVRQQSPEAMLLLELSAFLLPDANALQILLLLTNSKDSPLSTYFGDHPDPHILTMLMLNLLGLLKSNTEDRFLTSRISKKGHKPVK